jgi:hypothetical protein
MVVKLRHTKHMSTDSEKNVNHLLLHLAVRAITSRNEMIQLQTTRTLGVKKWFSGLGKPQ